MRSPIKCLFVGSVEMFNDEGTIKLYTGLLVEHVEACGAIGVDLTDLGLDIALVGRSARILEELDGLAEVLDSFFEGLLAELIVTLFLQCAQLRLQRVVVSRIDSSGLFWCRCSGLCWKLLDLGRRWLLFNRCGLDHFFNFYFLNSSCLFHLLDIRDRGRCLRSWSLTLELGEIWKRYVFLIRCIGRSLVLSDVLLTPLNSLLSLFVHRLKLAHSSQIVDRQFELLCLFVGQTSAEVRLDQHVDVVDVEGTVDDFGAVLDLRPLLLILSVAEGDVAEDGGLLLRNLSLENAEVLHGDVEDLGCVLVESNGLGVGSFLEFDLGLLLGSVDLLGDFVELGLQSLPLLGVDGRLRSWLLLCLCSSLCLGRLACSRCLTHCSSISLKSRLDAADCVFDTGPNLLQLRLLVGQVCL